MARKPSNRNDRYIGLQSKHIQCSKHHYLRLGPTRSRPKDGLRQGMTNQPAKMTHEVHESKVVCDSCGKVTWLSTRDLPPDKSSNKEAEKDEKRETQQLLIDAYLDGLE